MTEHQTPDKSPELQQADDMLTALMEQRNAALNEAVQLRAALRAAERRIKALEAMVPKVEATAINGHDKEAGATPPA